jgi:hypothetical protein
MKSSAVRSALEAEWPELADKLAEHDSDPITGGLEYYEMSVIAQFMGDHARDGSIAAFSGFFDRVEGCLADGDRDAVSLIVVGLLESLQNANITGVDRSTWDPYLGPRAQRAWHDLDVFWDSVIDAVQRDRQ